ncbi:MAG: SCP2 sterol-binding domain-containing protein [Ferrimicrobium sp.]
MGVWLSSEWASDAKELGANMPRIPGLSAVVQYIIVDGPGEDAFYYWSIGDGQLLDAALGMHQGPTVELTISYDDARRMQMGQLDATDAFMTGRIHVEGDIDRLVELLPLTSSAEYRELELELAARTDFGSL